MKLESVTNPRLFALISALALGVCLVGAAVAQPAPATTAAPAPGAPAAPAVKPATVEPAATAPAAGTAAAVAPIAAPAPLAPARATVKGVLTGNNVNIRKGPGTEYPFYITAPLGYTVEAIAQKGEWLEIEFPAKGFSWITKEFLQKIDDKTGIVIGSNVSIRGGPGTQYDRMYLVPQGHKFQILGMDNTGTWYKVAPVPGETAYILSEYVKLSGALPGGIQPGPAGPAGPAVSTTAAVTAPSVPEAPRPDAPAVEPPKPVAPPVADPYAEKLAESEKKFKAEIAKDNPLDWDLTPVEEMYGEVEANSNSAANRAQARTRIAQLKAYASIQTRAKELGKVDEELAARLKELEKQRAEELMAIPGQIEAPFTASGKVEKFYIRGLGGATHKIIEGETILYLLKSDIVNLADYEGKDCGIKGKIVTVPNLSVRLIEVNSATPLSAEAKKAAEEEAARKPAEDPAKE